jgi:hypothetical protein
MGNELAELLPSIQHLSKSQVDRLCAAFNENSELSGSFGFNGVKPREYGKGLIVHLERITGKAFKATATGIQQVTA